MVLARGRKNGICERAERERVARSRSKALGEKSRSGQGISSVKGQMSRVAREDGDGRGGCGGWLRSKYFASSRCADSLTVFGIAA